MGRLHHEPIRELRERDGRRVVSDVVQLGKYVGAHYALDVVPDCILVGKLREYGASVEDLTAQNFLVECPGAHQPGISAVCCTVRSHVDDQVEHEPRKALASDRFQHSAPAESLVPPGSRLS